MTDNFDSFFNEDPWMNIDSPEYPNGRYLYQKDQRFFVSMNDSSQIMFFVSEIGKYNIKKLPKLSGIEISIDNDHSGQTRLICVLKDELLKDKFALVAKDVAFRCSSFEGDKFLEECKTRIMSWAEFLKPSREGLRKPEWFGFWGELYMLHSVLKPSLDYADSINSWIGVEGKKQDFTFNNSALEIKTTFSGDANMIRISSLDQLHKVTENLYLLHLHINFSNDPSALSLKDMYESIMNEIEGSDQLKTQFANKASKLYGKASDDQRETKFNFLGMEAYSVSDKFPKITSENMASAITAAKYNLNPSSLKPFLVDLNFEEVIK